MLSKVLGECTARFDHQLAEKAIPNMVMIPLVISPDKLGWPTRRTRTMTAYLNPATNVWLGPESPPDCLHIDEHATPVPVRAGLSSVPQQCKRHSMQCHRP